MKAPSARKSRDALQYILNDYQFLDDYQILQPQRSDKNHFLGCIKNTQQKVRFIKNKYTQELLPRFKALHRLHSNGVILADNMFILEQCQEYYFYIIEAAVDKNNIRYNTLQNYLSQRCVEMEERKCLLSKIKILVDCLHQQGQAFAGLDPRKIIIDEDSNLYLSPFELNLQLKTDNYSRAYYPPEILNKIKKEEWEISQQMMLKWDMWSFGCICMELLLYQTPLFLSTSLASQMKEIQSIQIDSQLEDLEDSIKNIILSSLSIDASRRIISTSKTCDSERRVQEVDMSKSIISLEVKEQKCLNNMRQLNIHQQNHGNCCFTFNMHTLSSIKFQKELHISVALGKNYHFHLDYDEKLPRKHILNRKITITGSFSQLQQLLLQPIRIQLKEDSQHASIYVNAQCLTLIQNNKRIWNSPLISTYKSKNSQDFSQAKMRISCTLDTPQLQASLEVRQRQKKNQTKENTIINQHDFDSSHTSKEKGCMAPLRQSQQNKNPQKPSKPPKKDPQPPKIPTIAQISQNINLLTEELKRKMGVEQQEDPIKKQLCALFDLE